ncbi:YbjQ family protein [Pasteurellaceae bacterium 22721_9_1]
MIVTTTPNIEGKQIIEYKQMVFGEVVAGANFIRDFLASVTDVFGGRAGAYESKITRGRLDAIEEMKQHAQKLGANAIVGVEVNYASIDGGKSMFMIVASGTAVVVR